MSSEWRKFTLGDLTDWSSGGTPSKKNTEFWDGTIPWISASSMRSTRYSDSELKITSEGLKSGSRLAPMGSILLLVRGSILHQKIPVGITTKNVAFNQDVKGIQVKKHLVDSEIIDNWYLFYWLKANEKLLLSMVESTGIGAGKLDTKQLQELEVDVPSWGEQKQIVACCKAIEEKEIINIQINQTLEQMAQAIFKSWFVDFEPVKAKIAALEAGGNEDDALLAAMQAIAGSALFATDAADTDAPTQLARLQAEHPEQYATLRATAELFPSAMQESELGEIPEGWECMPLDEVAHYQNGLALQKFRPENEDDFLPVLKIAQLRAGYADGNEKASPNIRKDCIVNNGDVVFSWSGSLIVDVWCGGKAALNQHLFKVTSEEYPKWLYYYFTRHHLEEFQRIAAAKAVTMGHIKREHLKQALCAIPTNELIKRASKILGNILDKKIASKLQTKVLSELRDTLLPKLLSGELSVSAATDQITQAEEAIDV